jgi:hypothetical protein
MLASGETERREDGSTVGFMAEVLKLCLQVDFDLVECLD